MAVLIAASMAGNAVPTTGVVPVLGAYDCRSGGTSVFSDVPPSDAGCRFIHFLAAKGITGGCGGGKYCPTHNTARDQMAVFMTGAFGLKLYAP